MQQYFELIFFILSFLIFSFLYLQHSVTSDHYGRCTLYTLGLDAKLGNAQNSTLCTLGKFSCFFSSSAEFISKSNFSKISLRIQISVTNSLDPDQA